MSGGCLGFGYFLEIPEIAKTFTSKCLFKGLGFEIEPVLACLRPVLDCLDVTWACFEPVFGLSGAFWGRSWAVWRESGTVKLLSFSGFRTLKAAKSPKLSGLGEAALRALGQVWGGSWAALGRLLGGSGRLLSGSGPLWAVLGGSWAAPGRLWAGLGGPLAAIGYWSIFGCVLNSS